MDPVIMQYLIYAAIAAAGYLIRHWGVGAPSTPSPDKPGLSVGHGEILGMVLAALTAQKAPTPAQVQPDLAAILAAILAATQQQQPAPPAPVKSPPA